MYSSITGSIVIVIFVLGNISVYLLPKAIKKLRKPLKKNSKTLSLFIDSTKTKTEYIQNKKKHT